MADRSVSKIIDAPATFKSKVCSHFYTIDGTNNIDNEYAVCKNWLVKVKYTWVMKSHLQHHNHPDLIEKAASANVVSQQAAINV